MLGTIANLMSALRKLHAAALNTLARIFGAGSIFVGGVFAIWGLALTIDRNATVDVNGMPSTDPWIRAGVIVVGLVFVVIGILTLKAKPYQPKE
jgi:hypothetical protein